MKHKIELTRRMLRMLYEIFFTIILYMYFQVVFCKLNPEIVTITSICILYLISYVVREKVGTHVGIALCHIVFGVVVYFAPYQTGERIMLLFLAFYVMSGSLGYSLRGAKLKPADDFPWPVFLIAFVVYLYGIGMKHEILTNSTYILTILLLMVYYIMIYVEGVKEYVESTKDVQGLPLKQIVGTNTILVVFILIALILGVFMGGYIDLSGIIKSLGDFLVYVLRIFAAGLIFVTRFFVGLLSGGSGEMNSSEDTSHLYQDGKLSEGIFDDEFLLKIIFICVVFYVLYKVNKTMLYHIMAKRVYDNDIVDIAEKKKKTKMDRVNTKRIFSFVKSDEEKIRKYYKIRVLRDEQDISLCKDKTCREIESEMREKNLGDISELTDIYSRVRYGNVPPDKNMLKSANRLSKG